MTTTRPGKHPATLLAQGGDAHDGTRGVVPGVFPAVTFARDDEYALPDGRMYLRHENINGEHVEAVLAKLEDGAAAMVFSSGLAAAAAVFHATLVPGDAVLVTRVVYFGVRAWLQGFCDRYGMKVVFVDGTDAAALAGAVATHKPKLVWVETPGNPMLAVVDIEAAARAAHAYGALLVVDSTVATPIHTRPLALGADLVMHSATKFLNGHCDVLAGALVTARLDETWKQIHDHRTHAGAILGPFEAWLLLRGLRTLALRVERQSKSALEVARFLSTHPDVVEVLYPGLPGHAGHDVATRQMQGGFGGLLSVRVKGGAPRALDVAKRLRVFLRATSLGGVESLVEHRRSVEGPDSPTPDDLLRLSVGIEDVRDLVDDLTQALNGGAR